jgi:hypothetical protein
MILLYRYELQKDTLQYDPEAYAIETASVNVKEEFKRKIRISAGGSINRTVAFIIKYFLNMEHFHFSTFLIVF